MTYIIEYVALPSNKPHTPDPLPSKTLYPILKKLIDERTVWVSRPVPDKIAMILDVTPEVYAAHIPQDCPVHKFVNELYDYFHGVHFVDALPGGKAKPSQDEFAKAWHSISLAIGARSSTVKIEISKWNAKKRSIRIEMNPRKLGKAGIATLAKALGGKKGPFNLHALVNAARVTRMDVCVDIVGLRVTEVVAAHKCQGKRSYWSGQDGELETIYIHRKQTPILEPPDPLQPKRPPPALICRIYDRVRERTDAGKPPPFGPAPIVRVELRKRFNKRTLAMLPEITNPFKGLRVGFAWSQVSEKRVMWSRFVSVRRTASFESACKILNVVPATQIAFREAEKVPSEDVFAAAEIWAHWNDGLIDAGFGYFFTIGTGSSS